MSVVHPHLSRRSIHIVATVMLLAAVLLTLMHWHQDSAQRCEVCFARNLPSIHVPFIAGLTAPTRLEWRSPIEKPSKTESASFDHTASRAPPSDFSL